MKKTYIRPQSLSLTFTAEGMFATSVTKYDDVEDFGADAALSNGKGWNSNNNAIWGDSSNN